MPSNVKNGDNASKMERNIRILEKRRLGTLCMLAHDPQIQYTPSSKAMGDLEMHSLKSNNQKIPLTWAKGYLPRRRSLRWFVVKTDDNIG